MSKSIYGTSNESKVQLEELWSAADLIHWGAYNCSRFMEDEQAWTVAVVQKALDWGNTSDIMEDMIAWKSMLVHDGTLRLGELTDLHTAEHKR